MNTTIFLNQTGTIGQIYLAATQNITGSEFLTLLGLIIIIIAFFFLFGLPLEATAIFILPMLITFGVYSQNLISVLGLALIYLGMIFAKNFWIT
jgi:hypothetical protein